MTKNCFSEIDVQLTSGYSKILLFEELPSIKTTYRLFQVITFDFSSLASFLNNYETWKLNNIFEARRPEFELGHGADIEFDKKDKLPLSCILNVGVSTFLLGGKQMAKQVSQITRDGVFRIGTLPVDFQSGRCSYKNDLIYICFAVNDIKLCRSR